MVKVNKNFRKISVIFTEAAGGFPHRIRGYKHTLKRVMEMKKPRYLFWIILSEAAGALSGFISRQGMKIYMDMVIKPAFSPPEWLFPVAWGTLYALMGIGAARVEA